MPYEKSEMRTASPFGAMCHQATPCQEGDSIVGVAEQFDIDAHFGKHFGWVFTQTAKDIGQSNIGAYPQGRWRCLLSS